MPRRRRRNLKPTKRDYNLMEHPPTKTTWLCPRCEGFFPVNGSLEACWVCGTAKPERPKLVWPLYIVACKKVGRTPTGTRWTPDMEEPVAARKPVKRRISRKGAS